jgi:opacity protein-like surface antigen
MHVNFLFSCLYSQQIAWALNKGVKTEYKQFWDVDLGVTYIPWEKVKVDDLDGFAEGGMIDQETVDAGKNLKVILLFIKHV